MYEYLESKNIVLRKAKPSDYESMLKHVWSDKDVYLKMLFQPTFTIEEAKERCQRSINFQKDHYAYFVALKDTDEAIGMCAINNDKIKERYSECGIGIGTKFQGKGYGKEILSLLLDLAFNKLGAKQFEYSYFQDNIPSKKLAMSLGFEYDRSEEIIRHWDREKKIVDYCLLNKDKYEKR